LVFIPWQSLAVLAPIGIAIALLAFPRLGQALAFIIASYITMFIYEWTHYLIHSDYKAKHPFYRAIWRNHRLHHYKNEHYWFGVATGGTSDVVLGTRPDPATVAASPTAKNLHGL
jgi:sterol desaturase/sphingolipid hydroxylase (fatty acid hydroxylase superfamily)